MSNTHAYFMLLFVHIIVIKSVTVNDIIASFEVRNMLERITPTSEETISMDTYRKYARGALAASDVDGDLIVTIPSKVTRKSE
jgi:hypothetical protein